MQDDAPKLRVVERVEVKKYDGDPPKPGEHKEPVEVIVREEEVVLTKEEFEARYGLNKRDA